MTFVLRGPNLNEAVKEIFLRLGKDYPQLEYLRDLNKNRIPENIQLHEFYFQAGSMLGQARAQQNYISLNYTLWPCHMSFLIPFLRLC